MMQQESEERQLSKSDYERLCREACANPRGPGGEESVEDAYWWCVCQKVYHFLDIDFMFMPIEGASRGEVYRRNLHSVVFKRQSESFESLAIPNKYISEAMTKSSNQFR